MSYNKKQLVPIKIKYESSTPATPESGFGVIYFDNSTQTLAFKNAAGTSGLVATPVFPVNATAGTAGAPSIYFGDSDTGFYASAADNIDFTAAGGNIANFSATNIRFPKIGVSGKLYLQPSANTVYLKSSASEDLELVASTVYLGPAATQPLWVDGSNIHIWKPMIFRDDNTHNLGENGAGTFFRPKNVHVGTGLRVGGSGAALGSSSLVEFVSTSKAVVLPNITSAPTGSAGMVAFDTNNSVVGTNKLAIYNGSAWVTPTIGGAYQQHTSVTEVSTTSSTETDLISYTLPANTLNANKDQIDFEFAGTMDSGMGNWQIKVKFGSTTICDSGSLSMGSAARWIATGRIIRDSSSSTQKIFCQIRTTQDTGPGVMTYTNGTIDLTATAVLKMTADVDDMMMGTPACVNEYLSVTFKPAA